eukprot:TRINITY_DN7381_c0_g1_i20.p2 TRINITY_DN7381_c0_g1~~TRINITY_DN7381_c0_g1_i20.p2  ORF type:complete len:116 (+),score=16.26 TRINITY_DN7381_c0_g1_i20:202-549(+)
MFRSALESNRPAALFPASMLSEPHQRGYWDQYRKAAYNTLVLQDSDLLSVPRSRFDELTPPSERADRGGRGTGYRLQMLLKLAVAAWVPTKFYLVLDQVSTRAPISLTLPSPRAL